MTRRLAVLLVLSACALLAAAATPVTAEGNPPIRIDHVAPTGTLPGYQIYLKAVLTNATSARVLWRNATMAADAIVPMTNLTLQNATGWTFATYLPAQPSPTQIMYTINASNAGGYHTEGYVLSVDLPTPSGLTPGDQEAWVYTMVAALGMVVSTMTVLYWYMGRRLYREAR